MRAARTTLVALRTLRSARLGLSAARDGVCPRLTDDAVADGALYKKSEIE